MALKQTAVKRLFFDIETSPNIVLSWRTGYKLNIDHSNILRERAIIMIGWKWQGEQDAHVATWDNDQSDKALLTRFIKVLGQADEAVGHNVDKFDLPWVKTRCVFHGLPPLPLVKTADTLQWARRKLLFNSNRLDYIASFLGLGSKIHTEFQLWKSILLDHDKSALAKMKLYCARDVVLLEKVWEKLSAIVPAKTHAGVVAGRENWSCPKCSSENVRKEGRVYVTAKGTEQCCMSCNACGGYHNISMRAKLAYESRRR